MTCPVCSDRRIVVTSTPNGNRVADCPRCTKLEGLGQHVNNYVAAKKSDNVIAFPVPHRRSS